MLSTQIIINTNCNVLCVDAYKSPNINYFSLILLLGCILDKNGSLESYLSFEMEWKVNSSLFT